MSNAHPKEAFVELATPAQVEQYFRAGAKNPYDFGFIPPMTRLLLAHTTIGSAFRALYAQVMFRPGSLSRSEREMVAAVAAAAQDCFY